MSRKPLFDPHLARGILTVVGEAGQALGEASEREDRGAGVSPALRPEEVSEEPRESQPEAPWSDVPHSESSAESADKPEGDLAARRLFAWAEWAEQGKVVEPPPAEAPPAEAPPAEPPPGEPQSAVTHSGGQPALPALDRANRAPDEDSWLQSMVFAKAGEGTPRVVRWLEARLAAALREED